tara:strand:- start:59 stop:445 length:387 start_codon:yes stop_codon:yes gene_type:complete
MKASLTPMQMKVYDFIREFNIETGTVPTAREIGDHIDKSPANAHRIIKGLIARGYINPGPARTWRSYTLAKDNDEVNPLLGTHFAATEFVRKHRKFMKAVESNADTEEMGHEVQKALQKLTAEVGENV